MNRIISLSYGRFSDTSQRFSSMLFVAALLHGALILGVTFSDATLLDSDEVPVLKVTLLTDSSVRQRKPDKDDYLANRNSSGGTSTPEGTRPTNAISTNEPLMLDGDPRARGMEDRAPRDPDRPAEQLVSRSEADREIPVQPRATPNAAAAPERKAAMINLRSKQTQSAEIDVEARLPDASEGPAAPSPNTTASVLASYLDSWRQRVERIGTLNFPEKFLAGNRATRRPTLLVAINADGSLEEAIVQNSSGDPAVDQAALDILRMAEPFEPFPDAVLAEFEMLRFAYDWDFIEGRRSRAR